MPSLIAVEKISLLLNTKWINNLLTVTLLAGACIQYVACLFKEPVFSIFDEINFLLLYSAKIYLIHHINSKCLFKGYSPSRPFKTMTKVPFHSDINGVIFILGADTTAENQTIVSKPPQSR